MNSPHTINKRAPHPAEIIARGIAKALLLIGGVVALFTLFGCSTHPAPTHRQRAAWPFEGTRMMRQPAARAVAPATWPTLRVQWLPAARAEGYFVYHSTTPSYSSMQFLGATTNTYFLFQSQKLGFVGVKATNQFGISGWGIPKQ